MAENSSETSILIQDFERLVEVLRPKGTGPVPVSPYFDYIIEAGLKGLEPVYIHEELKKAYPDEDQFIPAPELIAAYFAEHLPIDLRLPFHQLSKFSDPRRRPNPFTTLVELVAVQRYRVGEALVRDVGGEKSENVRREVDLCHKICLSVIRTAQEIGQLPWVSPAPHPSQMEAQDIPKPVLRDNVVVDVDSSSPVPPDQKRELLSGITADEARNILNALDEIWGK